MANYSTYSTTYTNYGSSTSSDGFMYYTSSDNIALSNEKSINVFNAAGKKKKDTSIEFRSKILPWVMKNLRFDAGGTYLLLHSPLYNIHRKDICRDFETMYKFGYMTRILAVDNYNCISAVSQEGGIFFNQIFVEGVLEHMPGVMAQALFLKNLMSALNPRRTSYLILSTRSREQIHKEAARCNYPSDGRGYLITLPGGKQSRIEGLDHNEVKSIIAYGRIGSITNIDKLSKLNNSHSLNDSHIIICNGI